MILDFLENSEYVKREQIAIKLNISKRKTQKLIDDLNHMLMPAAEIESKTGIGNGYRLVINDKDNYRSYIDSLKNNVINRELFILKSLLVTDKYIRIIEFEEKLYVSERVIRNCLSNIKIILEKYNIEINTKPHYGIKLIGLEKDKRLCLVNEIFKNEKALNLIPTMIEDYKKNIEVIKSELESILQEEKYKIQDFALDNLTLHILVTIYRIKNKQGINPMQIQTFDKRIDTICKKIVFNLEKLYNIHFDQNECNYISVHLLTKEDYSRKTRENLSEDVCELVLDMLKRIDSIYQTKLHLDFELCMSLSLHFIPLLYRIEHNMNLENPIITDIKRNYIYEYELACEGAELINKRYNCKLSEDEIGFIALDIRLSLTNRRIVNKNKILIICSTGRGSSEILKINFRNNFGKYIESLEVCSLNEALKNNLDYFDYIFTTVPFDIHTKTPIFLINSFLCQDDMVKLHEIFIKQNETYKYFDSRLFINNLKAQSKEEIIHSLIEYIRRFYNLPIDFEELVLKRESMASTALGNNVAFPHPYRMTCDETFICIASLKKPIKWGKKKVKLVIMAAISKEADDDIQYFYEAIVKIIGYQENVNLLIHSPNIETVYEILKNDPNNVAD